MLSRISIALFLLAAFQFEAAAAPMRLCVEGRVDSVLCKEYKAALEARADAQALKQKIQSVKNAPLDGLLLDQINT